MIRRPFGRAFVSIAAILALAAVTAAVALLTQPAETRRPEGPGVEPPIVVVAAVRLEPGHAVRRAFVGRVEARQESDLGFEIGGMLAEVTVEEGDRVAAGAAVARLDRARLEARRDELEAVRDEAAAAAELARLTRERLGTARRSGAATDQELDEAELGLRSADARRAAADAALASLAVDLEKAILRSPFDAIVARRAVDAGRVLAAGTPVVRLLERFAPEARVGVAGPEAEAIRPGERLTVELGGREVAARVLAVLPVRDRAARSVDVRLELDAVLAGGPDGPAAGEPAVVRAGDLVRLPVERFVAEPGFRVPLTALSAGDRGLWTVLVLEPDAAPGRPDTAILRRLPVELLHEEAGHAFVRGPVDEGASFVATGLHRVTPGMRVRPAIEPAAIEPAAHATAGSSR